MRWIKEIIRAHYYFDPLAAVLWDIAILLFILFIVLAVVKGRL